MHDIVRVHGSMAMLLLFIIMYYLHVYNDDTHSYNHMIISYTLAKLAVQSTSTM